MTQQNSVNYQGLVNKTFNSPLYGQLKFIKLLGQRGEVVVFAVQSTNSQNPKEFALKLQKTRKNSEKSFIQTVIDYQRVYDNDTQQISGIITILDSFLYSNYHALLMELGSSNLRNYIQTQSSLSIEQRIEISIDICKSINFIHSKNFFHYDIKPENFLLVGNQFKLIDFGLKVKEPEQKIYQTNDLQQILYHAPELIKNRISFHEKVDTWALGCLIYEILSGQSYIPKSEQIEDIKNEIQFKYLDNQDQYFKKIEQLKIPEQLQTTLKQMLEYDSSKRISISEASKIFISKSNKIQVNPILQTQMNPILQTQMNPILQTQMNPILQTQMNPVLQTQLNPVLQQQQTFQQPNQALQSKQPTLLQPQPFPQQNIQKQQLSQGNIEQVCQLILGEIKKQISENQNLKVDDNRVKNLIKENNSKQDQNDVENYFDDISRIFHNLNKKVQEIQAQQIREIQISYEQKLQLKDEEINQYKQQLADKQLENEQYIQSKIKQDQQNQQQQHEITSLNNKLNEQSIQIQQLQANQIQSLNQLIDQVKLRFQNFQRREQEEQQQQLQDQNDTDVILFENLFQELSSRFGNNY